MTITPPTTPGVIRHATESIDLDDLIGVGLALHLFTETARFCHVAAFIDLHRATTVLTKQIGDTLTSRPEHDVLHALLRLVTDPDRAALPDQRSSSELCGDSWSLVRATAYGRAEQTIAGADHFGVGSMLRLAATRAVAMDVPWWGTPVWRSRLTAYLADHPIGALEHITLASAPEQAPEPILRAIVG